VKYIPSPTGKDFIASRKYIKGLMGPIGSGKSTVCLMDLLARAQQQEPWNGVRRTRFAILRNTSAQLRTTVKPLIDEWLVSMPTLLYGAPLGAWKLTEGVFEMKADMPDGSLMHTELLLTHADTPDDVRRLLSLNLSAAWVEEAREIDAEVFKGLIGRVSRFPSKVAGGATYPGIVFSTNAPVVDSYWHGLIDNPPSNAEVLIQPPAVFEDGRVNPEADNLLYLDEDYYPNLMAANTPEWVDVYLRNQFGPGNAGQPVFKASFRRAFHTAPQPLLAVPSQASPLIVGADNGLQGAAVVMQQDARSRINVLTTAYVPEDTTMSYEKFLDTLLIPHLLKTFPTAPRSSYLFVMDPACFQRSQVSEATIAQAVQARGFRAIRASTNDPVKRHAAAEGLLTRAVDAQAGLLIDGSCAHLLKALEWGYRYRKGADGTTQLTVVKNHHSHIAEAFEYASLHFNAQFSQTFTAFQSSRREVLPRTYTYV
jgi:hypothetical protein